MPCVHLLNLSVQRDILDVISGMLPRRILVTSKLHMSLPHTDPPEPHLPTTDIQSRWGRALQPGCRLQAYINIYVTIYEIGQLPTNQNVHILFPSIEEGSKENILTPANFEGSLVEYTESR